jgi:Leucine-rich repeat (LRR) protein
MNIDCKYISINNPTQDILSKEENEQGNDKQDMLLNKIVLSNLPVDVLKSHILTKLNVKEWGRISITNHFFKNLVKSPVVVAHLLNKKLIPKEKIFEFFFQAGPLLTEVNLFKLNITEEMFNELLEKCPNIQELSLGWCENVIDAALVARFPKSLQSLGLYGYKNLVDATIAHLPQNLQFLNLCECENLTDAAINHLPQGLQFLGLSGCKKLTNDAIAHLPQGLQSLDLSGCEITNDAIAHLPQGLQSLDLSGCKITDDAIAHLPQRLQSLNLSRCSHLTNHAIAYLPPYLEFLFLIGCENLVNITIAHLPQRLQSINLYQ